MSDVGTMVLGMLLGAVILACFTFRQVGRAIGKALAVVGIAIGTGLITWAIAGAIAGDFRPMQSGPISVMSLSQVFGWGIGSLAGGITSLVLAMVGQEQY